MAEDTLAELIEKTDLLTAEEQLQLIQALVEKIRHQGLQGDRPRKKWSDLKGTLLSPACGEDAQAYISRCRDEADRKRHTDVTR